MTAKKLTLVSSDPPASPSPPGKLGNTGQALWDAVCGEYAIEDSGGRELLFQACAAADRAAALREHIDRDGEVIRIKGGGLKAHPALKDELGARSFVVRTLHRLGLDVEPIGRVGRPAGR